MTYRPIGCSSSIIVFEYFAQSTNIGLWLFPVFLPGGRGSTIWLFSKSSSVKEFPKRSRDVENRLRLSQKTVEFFDHATYIENLHTLHIFINDNCPRPRSYDIRSSSRDVSKVKLHKWLIYEYVFCILFIRGMIHNISNKGLFLQVR